MLKANRAVRTLVAGLAMSTLLAAGAGAQTSSLPTTLPAGVFAAEQDIKLATAGTYALDEQHAAVLARVSHLGYSYSIFRFDTVKGTLAWDPAAVAKSTLSVTVATNSVSTNVPGFAAEIAGDNFLKSKAFPEATFVSSGFRQTDARSGKVDGQFTLMGKTRPLTFDVTLVGAGKGFMGSPRIGVHARASIDPQDYGLPALMTEPIELVIDVEFARTP